jgi:serine/threonine-protein kinase
MGGDHKSASDATAPPASERDDDELFGLPSVGTTIAGKYLVERVIGAGGMGVVVAARHRRLGGLVAIKFLRHEANQNAADVARFVREARATVSLRSEHVARVIDIGTFDSGAPYMIMEHLTGTDLESWVDDHGPMQVSRAVDCILQACEAVAEAHARGIVHRDLKPSNLFVCERPDGEPLVKVLDFGIAKALDADAAFAPSLTTTGIALGTPHNMSPEQVRDAKSVDRRSDIWGLGTVLHHIVCGTPPFQAGSLPALCAMIVADPVPRLRTLRPDAPAALERLVARCLAKVPAERYQDCSELARDLVAFASPAGRRYLERVTRITEGRASLLSLAGPDEVDDWEERVLGKVTTPAMRASSDASGDWESDSLADTVASGAQGRVAAKASAVSTPGDTVSGCAVEPDDARGSLRPARDAGSTRRTLVRAAVGVVVAAAVAAVYGLGHSPSDDVPPPASAARGATATPSDPPPVREPDPPPRTVEPGASALASAPPRSGAPRGRAVAPPRKTAGAGEPPLAPPPPAPAPLLSAQAPPPPPKPVPSDDGDPLVDRK